MRPILPLGTAGIHSRVKDDGRYYLCDLCACNARDLAVNECECSNRGHPVLKIVVRESDRRPHESICCLFEPKGKTN